MEPFKCPNCRSAMKRVADPDIATDKCPSCGGIFLEKGELNAFATGMKGNIEYSSIFADDNEHSDKFPLRACPKCPEQRMKKVELLVFSDIIFDFCQKCESFFLDKGEVKTMNEYLKKLTPHGVEQEYRGRQDGRLVRIDRRLGAYIAGAGMMGMATRPAGGTDIRVSVYMNTPLRTDLRVFQEGWFARLVKSMGIYKFGDIPTGNAEFDKLFRVHGEDEKAIVEVLHDGFRNMLVDFVSKKPKIYSQTGSVEITSNLIRFNEGPYEPDKMPDLMKRSEPIIQDLLKLAESLEGKQ